MPDVMTPESMVSKLDAFESLKEGDDETSQEDLDVSVGFSIGRSIRAICFFFAYVRTYRAD